MSVIWSCLGDIDRFLEPAMTPAHRVRVNRMGEVLVNTDVVPPDAVCVWIAALPRPGAMNDAQLVLTLAGFL